MAKQELEKTKTNPPAVAAVDYGDYAGSGYENTDASDYQIPFVAVLQSNSPQIDDSDSKHIDGAKAGMMFDTVTDELFAGDDGIRFIPCMTRKEFIEYVPRTEGGGFRGTHSFDSDVVVAAKEKSEQFGKYQTPEGNELVETHTMFGLRVDADGFATRCCIAFKSTQIKAYKNWLSKARGIHVPGFAGEPPLFSHVWRIKTVRQENDKGKFYGFRIAIDGANAQEARLTPDDELFQQAAAFSKLSTTARQNFEAASNAGEGNDDVPF